MLAPVLVVFFRLQRYFIRGIALSGLKGRACGYPRIWRLLNSWSVPEFPNFANFGHAAAGSHEKEVSPRLLLVFGFVDSGSDVT